MSLDIDSILKKALKSKADESKENKSVATETRAVAMETATSTAVSTKVEVPKVEEKPPITTSPAKTETKEESEPPRTEVKLSIVAEAPASQSNTVETLKPAVVLPRHEEEGLKKVEELEILEEDIPAPPKLVITIYGEKGTGKTTTAMSFREKVAVFSFDNKSAIVKFNMYRNDPRIKVFTPVRYWDKTDKAKIPESAKKVWDALIKTVEALGKSWKPDWIVIDAVEEFEKLIEQVMRYDYGLGPYDGIANRNIWKYRKDLFYSFLAVAERNANLGIIFTTYPEYSEHISQGEVVSRKPVPKWADYLQLVTDIVLYTFVDDRTNDFKVKVITSKLDEFLPSGKTFVVTGSNLWTVAKLGEKINKLNAFLSNKSQS